MSAVFSRLAPLRVAKYALGGLLASFFAALLGLSYSTSAGVIAILSIQTTRKQTLALVLRRFTAFFAAMALAFGCFSLLGYHLIAFGLFLLLFAAFCQWFGLQEALVMNTVLVLHLYAERTMNLFWLRNELLLLLIGAGIGILVNLYMPGAAKAIRQSQAQVEQAFRDILQRMADRLLTRSKQGYTDSCFAPLEQQLEGLARKARENQDNALLSDQWYFVNYVSMRQRQLTVLRRIYDNIHRLDQVPEQALSIADLLEEISRSFHEHNNAAALLQKLHGMQISMRDEPLPQSRAEFENRALLYRVLYDLEDFLQLKADFAAALTEQERSRFWGD
ncbi:MAG: aromatic acid exporter family protein [Fournierella sp.]|uniref:aromatic acid exporter family protein n=1 Tax=Allofournierella sp. TaxID=1940256 RepID=UPI002A84092E|nr:aromatic acid exporter family protein [Fournierella sp.]MDY4166086.1 aromatic acid exporter family protein [Fournierella sp.]